MASKESTIKVVTALRSLGRPMLVSELVRFTGLTTNTVKAVLKERGHAEPGYPTRWQLAADVIIPRRLSTMRVGDVPVEVPYKRAQNWAEKHVELGQLADKLGNLPPKPTDDIRLLHKLVADAATIYASMAFDIQEAMEGPDWFERLGGNTEETL